MGFLQGIVKNIFHILAGLVGIEMNGDFRVRQVNFRCGIDEPGIENKNTAYQEGEENSTRENLDRRRKLQD